MAEVGEATLRYTDDSGEPVVVTLSPAAPRLLVGRSNSCDVVISWDPVMSREHALLERIGTQWFVSDDGMSRHGTFIRPQDAQACRTEQRVRTRRRLESGDRLLLGQTVLTFRPAIPPVGAGMARTRTRRRPMPALTPAQERVLTALCQPLLDTDQEMPAANQQIALDLHVSVDVVKDHLQELYRKFGVRDLPRGEKRLRLAQLAMRNGLV